ncbi:MAG: hypothetical protein KJZ73_14300 [Pseudorhodoplanes sp.]|nr:hypothetical protein [Pseudorhodoplanes sp.]MBW7947960.1 hypothetical protein [Pseudorhodoplanes sp.]MCL4712410.1 hypothetical protein [Pseudorhodoplanes sp.]
MRLPLPVLAVLLVAGSDLRAETTARAHHALTGHWGVARAEPAPWLSGEAAAALKGQSDPLIDQRVSFSSTAMSSRYPVLNCSDAEFSATRMPPEGLFQGNLPGHPAKFAKRLGFKDGEIDGVDVTCSAGAFSFHFIDRNTALFALDNVIYRLRRR